MLLNIQSKLQKRTLEGNLRHLTVNSSLIDFASNDYLGLARSPTLQEMYLAEWKQLADKLGSTGSRLLTGNSRYTEALEDYIAHFHQYETALIFNCGYMANLGLLSTIAEEGDILLFDAHVHASMRAGIKLSPAKAFAFKHNNIEHLAERLNHIHAKGNKFICIESMYSTDGSKAPLMDISRLAKAHNALLVVDEAHALGVYGCEGRGLVAESNLTKEVFAQVVTFGKALGVAGAAVLGDKVLKNLMINFTQSYIYTTALPYYALAAIKCGYRLLPFLQKERTHLHQLTQYFQKSSISVSSSHIQPIYTFNTKKAIELEAYLRAQGFSARALRSPTVQRRKECIRICLHAFNTLEEVKYLVECLRIRMI